MLISQSSFQRSMKFLQIKNKLCQLHHKLIRLKFWRQGISVLNESILWKTCWKIKNQYSSRIGKSSCKNWLKAKNSKVLLTNMVTLNKCNLHLQLYKNHRLNRELINSNNGSKIQTTSSLMPHSCSQPRQPLPRTDHPHNIKLLHHLKPTKWSCPPMSKCRPPNWPPVLLKWQELHRSSRYSSTSNLSTNSSRCYLLLLDL